MTKRIVAFAVLLAAGLVAYSGAPSPDTPPVDAFGDPLPSGALARMGTMRLRHGTLIYTVAFSPDGRRLASGSNIGELRLWDAATGKLLWLLVDPSPNPVDALAFSPDGELLAANRYNRTGLWQVSTGKKLHEMMDNPRERLTSVAFAPDGKELAIGTDSGAIKFLDPNTGKSTRKIAAPTGADIVVVYSKDGKTLASAGKDKTARIWDAATGKELHRFEEPELVWDAALSPDGKRLATKTQKAVHLWDVASRKEVHRFEEAGSQHRSLAFSPDGKVLGSRDVLWDASTGKEICRCKGALQGDIAISPDGKTVAAGGSDGVVYLFDAATGAELPLTRAGWNRGRQQAAGFTSDDKGLVLHGGGAVRLYETATGKEIRKYDADTERVAVAVLSPDGKLLAASTNTGMTFLWEAATGKTLFRMKGPEKRAPATHAWSLAFAPDGRTLAAAASEKVIRLWDVATGKELRQFRGHEGWIMSLVFLPDGKTLVSAGSDDTRFWDAANGQERRERLKSTGSICSVSPDGQLVATSDLEGDQVVHIREVADGKEVRQFPVINPYSCAFSPDGKTLAAYADNILQPEVVKPILLLEMATGKVRMKLTGHSGMGFGQMVFSADGKMLATGGGDTTALVWDATGRMRGGRFETAALSPKELSASWAALAGGDAAEAYRAIWALTAAPEQTLPLLREHLRPLPAVDAKETARRLTDLDSDDFDVREKAEKELGEQGDRVESALRKTLDEPRSAELRRRVEALLVQFQVAGFAMQPGA